MTALQVDERASDSPGIAIPRPEVCLVLRYSPSAHQELDLHALGPRQQVRRKQLRGGQRVVAARLQLGTVEAVLGVSASELAGQIVPMENLWGVASTRLHLDRFAHARSMSEVGAMLEGAIAERLAMAGSNRLHHVPLVLEAASRVTVASVRAVAADLGLSERHLRRLFHRTMGMGPKKFAQLARFRTALSAARGEDSVNWARVAVAAGYYDQAHLIAEFRTIAGVTPQALLGELRTAQAIG